MTRIPGTGATTPLSEVVDELAMLQGNAKRNHYLAYLKHAERIWKRLLRNSLWSVRYKKIDVPDNKIITLPDDIECFVSLCVVDHCGNLQSITYNPNINTLQLECPEPSCSCTNCNGKDSLCAIMDQITMTTETVNLDGSDYVKTILMRMDAFGNLEKVIDAPVWDVTTSAVVRDVYREVVVALEVDEKCCILPTERNRELLFNHCGAFLMRCDELLGRNFRRNHVDSPPLKSDFGHFKWDATNDREIHIRHSKATQVIVAYQSNGDDIDGEMLIPDYAIDAMHFGIMWRQAAFSPIASLSAKNEAKKSFNTAETQLRQFLNPIDVSEFMRIQSIIPKWG